ncbi:MAG: hypothetical protein HZB35_08065 [Nitrospirae bacterium]|nr:hypothetical protein [Nitrospirota bacterium]
MDQTEKRWLDRTPSPGAKRRLETQISRRKKAPPVPSLEAEWDESSSQRSTDLKMPPDKMTRSW